jgi:hypothetical protein
MNITTVRNLVTVALISKTIIQKKAALRIKRIAAGIALLITSWILGIIGIVGGIGSLFFALSHITRFAYASAITGGISILIAIVITIEGIRLLKK